MGADYALRCSDLQEELEKAKFTLLALNNSIRRIIGQTPSTSKEIRGKGKQPSDLRRKDSVGDSRKRTHDSKSSIFNRLSPSPAPCSNNEELRPKLTSHVVRELPSRQEVVAAQSADSESHARNRRMFGSLLGTLHKFCQEESRLQQKEEKKALIEKKLEKQEMLERELLKKERETLFLNRKRKQIQIRQLELKMSRLKDFEVWESSMQHLNTFIKTKTMPAIYYRPKELSRRTEKLLAEHQRELSETINKRRQQVSRDLKLLEMIDNTNNAEHIYHEDSNNYYIKSNHLVSDDNNLDNRRNKSSSNVLSTIRTPQQQESNEVDDDDASDEKTAIVHKADEMSLTSSVVIVKRSQ